MSSAKRCGRTGEEGRVTPSIGALVQLIALSRILARQAAREAIAARNAPLRNTEQGNDNDGPARP